MRKSYLLVVSIALLSAFILSCGGGGGGDSNPISQTEPVVQNQAQIAETSSKGVYEISNSVLEIISFTHTQGFSNFFFDDFASLATKRTSDLSHIFKSYLATETEECEGGGFVRGRETSSGYYLEFYNCALLDIGTKEVWNGALNLSHSDNTLRVETNNLSIKVYTLNNKLSWEYSINGRYSGKVVTGTCPYLNDVTANLKFSFKEDFNLDGRFDIDFVADYTNFNINLSNVSIDRDCYIKAFTATVKSDSRASILNNINRDYFSYAIPSNSNLSYEMNSDERATRLKIAGSCSINTPCLQGTFNYNTIKIISTEHGKICPTDGVLKITGTSDMTVTYTATGGIQIDYKSDGTVDQTLASCLEARICRQ